MKKIIIGFLILLNLLQFSLNLVITKKTLPYYQIKEIENIISDIVNNAEKLEYATIKIKNESEKVSNIIERDKKSIFEIHKKALNKEKKIISFDTDKGYKIMLEKAKEKPRYFFNIGE